MSLEESFRPMNDVVLVRVHPQQRYSDILAIPDTAAGNHPVGRGTVLRAGPGCWKVKKSGGASRVFIRTTVKPGDEVVFHTAAARGKQGERFHYEMPDNCALIKESDIFFVMDEHVQVVI